MNKSMTVCDMHISRRVKNHIIDALIREWSRPVIFPHVFYLYLSIYWHYHFFLRIFSLMFLLILWRSSWCWWTLLIFATVGLNYNVPTYNHLLLRISNIQTSRVSYNHYNIVQERYTTIDERTSYNEK